MFLGGNDMPKQVDCFIAVALVVASEIAPTTAANAERDRTILPRPPQPFQGITKQTLEGSAPSFTEPVKAPPGAPNILLILIDDAGFGNPSTFGGPVATPTLDKLAAHGSGETRARGKERPHTAELPLSATTSTLYVWGHFVKKNEKVPRPNG